MIRSFLKSSSLINTIAVVSGIITIVEFIIGIAIFVIDRLGINVIKFQVLQFLYKNGIWIYAVSATVFAAIMTVKVFRYRKVQMETRRAISDAYYTFLHAIRNTVGELRVSQKNKGLNIGFLTNATKDVCNIALDGLCNTFKALCREEVSACIKLVDYSSENKENNRYVFTFARSANSDGDRITNDESEPKDYIIKNTDFNDIIEQRLSYFYKCDLIKYDAELKKVGKEYENTTPNWDKFYRSTIVVPIRIAHRRSHTTSKENEYLIIGFLCVDSMSTNIFIASQEKYFCNIMKSYAALLYTFFSLYKDLLKDCPDKEPTSKNQEKNSQKQGSNANKTRNRRNNSRYNKNGKGK